MKKLVNEINKIKNSHNIIKNNIKLKAKEILLSRITNNDYNEKKVLLNILKLIKGNNAIIMIMIILRKKINFLPLVKRKRYK